MDPTKVESVQDVLARAAANGLLRGMEFKPSKTGKKKKSMKKRTASATSEPSSPSCRDEEEGGESGIEQDSKETSEHEGDKDEGELKDGEDVGKRKEGKGVKKQRRRKQNPKQSKKAPANAKIHKKKTKKKESPSQVKLKQAGSKPRRVPRLTLSLLTSPNPPSDVAQMIALARTFSGGPAAKPQQAGLGFPPPCGKQSSPAQPAPSTSHQAPSSLNNSFCRRVPASDLRGVRTK